MWPFCKLHGKWCMSMPLFFVSPEQAQQDVLCLTGEDARHIAGSLRMQPGERLTLSDGAGLMLHCEVEAAEKTAVTVRVCGREPCTSESSCAVTLFQCLPKGDKMDGIVQKSVELGAVRIVPVLSSRCISRPDGAALEKKRRRWQQIAAEAAGQSGRGRIPEVAPACRWEQAVQALSSMQYGLLLFIEQQGSSLSQVPASAAEVGLLVGPEGGISPQEADCCRQAGILCVGLGPRILRTETAGPAAIAVLQYLTGNFE